MAAPRVLRVVPRTRPVVACEVCRRALKAMVPLGGEEWTVRRHRRSADGEWCTGLRSGPGAPEPDALPTRGRRNLTVRDAALTWVNGRLGRKEIRPATAEGYRAALKDFCEVVGRRRPVASLTTGHVEEYQADCVDRHVTSETLRLRLKILRQWSAWLVQEHLVAENPCRHLKLPPKARSVPRGLRGCRRSSRRSFLACSGSSRVECNYGAENPETKDMADGTW